MFERFTERARRVLFFAKYEANNLGANAIEPEHILLGILREDMEIAQRHFRNRKNIEMIRKEIERRSVLTAKSPATIELTLSADTKRVLRFADDESRRLYEPMITNEHILLGILRDTNSLSARILNELGFTLSRMRGELQKSYERNLMTDSNQKASTLAQYSSDMTQAAASDQLDPLIGREHEIQRIIQILCRRTKNNPVLIGEPGVGKTAIVEGLAHRIVYGNVPRYLEGKRILALDLALILAGTRYRGQFEERLKDIMRELIENRDLIVFIDEVHTLVGAGTAEGSLDAANILKPALARGEIQCIGATTPGEFRKVFERNHSLERRFQAVKIVPPTEEQTRLILEGIKSRYEEFHRVRYTRDAIEAAVTQSQRYIPDRFLPDKAIDVMDEAGAQVKLQKEALLNEFYNEMAAPDAPGHKEPLSGEDYFHTVSREDVEEVISGWTGIPATSLKEEERERLLQIEEKLHARIIGQDRAISALARSIRRARAGLKNAGRPIGSFLFLGPTGVGKTEVARTLAELLFGSERALIRFDMSEYMEKHSVSKLIGSPPGYVGYEEGGHLTERVRRSPYSVLLLDEIEKAHSDIFNILLQVFEDGTLTDSLGNQADFKNTIIIMTSNIGARFIQKRGIFGFQTQENESSSLKDGVMLAVRQTFSPELINRLDEIIIFDPLTSNDLFAIVTLLVDGLNLKLAEARLQVRVTDDVKWWIINNSCADQSFGARPLRRALQKYVEDPLSDAIISGVVGEQAVLEFHLESDAVKFRPADAGLGAADSKDLVAAH